MRELNIQIKRDSIKEHEDGTGRFSGLLSVFGNVDSYGDIVERGAFKRTIADQKKKGKDFKLLWQHDGDVPIGLFKAKETETGLEIEAEVNLETQRGREAFSDIKKGIVDGLSIGFSVIKQAWEGAIRHLKELRLWEGSAVTFPANDLALIQSVKGLVPFQGLKVSEAGVRWRQKDALTRVRKWAGAIDAPNSEYREAFLYVEKGNEKDFTGYRWPIADVIDGALVVVPEALAKAAADLASNTPEELKLEEAAYEELRVHVTRYYKRQGLEPPWERKNLLNVQMLELIGWAEVARAAIEEGLDPGVDPVILGVTTDALNALREAVEDMEDAGDDAPSSGLTSGFLGLGAAPSSKTKTDDTYKGMAQGLRDLRERGAPDA